MTLAANADSPVARRLGTLALGLVLVAAGVATTIRAEIGVAPYDVLTTGLVALTGVPIGIAAMLLPLAFVIIGVLIGGRPGPGTVLAVLLVGPILGMALEALPIQEAMSVRLVYFVVGFVVISAGITAVVISEIGSGPAELVMLAIHDRGYPLAPVRTGVELSRVAIGWVMGGQVGVGTVVFALLIGPTLKRPSPLLGSTPSAPARRATAPPPAPDPPRSGATRGVGYGERPRRWPVTVSRTTLWPLAGLVVAIAGCGDDDEPVTLVEGVSIDVQAIDNTFRPEEVEVTAGTEVVWTNDGRNDHNVLPVEGDDWGVEADAFVPGDEYSHRFTEPGTYDYYCSLHGTTTKGMVGTIVVTG